MQHALSRALLTLSLLIGACGGAEDMTADEATALGQGHEATATQQDTLAVADELFDFDPTIDPTKSAAENAQAIAARAMARIPCATVALDRTTLTLSAPSSGCTVANGVTLAGQLTATVSKGGSTITVILQFTEFVLNGKTTSGTMTLVTTDGSTFQVDYRLTRNGTSVSGTLNVVGAPGQLTAAGTLSYGSTTAVLTGIVWKRGDCYPSAGTVAVTVGRATTTYTFTATTPTTGEVSMGRGRTAELPSYGTCPPTS